MSAPCPRHLQPLVDAAFLASVEVLREAYAVELTAKDGAEDTASAKLDEDDSGSDLVEDGLGLGSDDDQRTAYSPKTCAGCGTAKTPLWRKGWWDEEYGMSVPLCNACGMKHSKGHFCRLCHVPAHGRGVYTPPSELARCEDCLQYSHVECEAMATGIAPAPISLPRGRMETSLGYKCVYCRQ